MSKDYKAKVRQLAFNLKDPANPGLRARVLQVGRAGPALQAARVHSGAARALPGWQSVGGRAGSPVEGLGLLQPAG